MLWFHFLWNWNWNWNHPFLKSDENPISESIPAWNDNNTNSCKLSLWKCPVQNIILSSVKSYCGATFQLVSHWISDELIWPLLSKNSSPRGCDIRIPTCFTGILGAVRADIARWREILQGFLRSLQIWAARHQIKLKVFKQTARNSTEIQRQRKVDKFKDIPSETTEFFRASVGFGLFGEMKMSVIMGNSYGLECLSMRSVFIRQNLEPYIGSLL